MKNYRIIIRSFILAAATVALANCVSYEEEHEGTDRAAVHSSRTTTSATMTPASTSTTTVRAGY